MQEEDSDIRLYLPWLVDCLPLLLDEPVGTAEHASS